MFERAYIWVCQQKLDELKKAQRHWPNSMNFNKRQAEISDLEDKIEKLKQKLLSS